MALGSRANASRERNHEFGQIAHGDRGARSRRPTRPRMRSSARRGVMSCPSSCAPRRGAASSSAGPVRSSRAMAAVRSWARVPSRMPRPTGSTSLTPSGSSRGCRGARGGGARLIASSSAALGGSRLRSRARARSGCCWRPSGLRMTWAPSGRATRPIRRGGRRALPRTGRDGWLRHDQALSAARGASGEGRTSPTPTRR